MKILLTGAFGNVGSEALKTLLRESSQYQNPEHRNVVTVLEKRSPLAEENEAAVRQEFAGIHDFETVWGDLTSVKDVEDAVRGKDVIIHLAAVIPPLAFKLPQVARKVNVGGTINLIEAALKQPTIPRFILASSYSVVGPRTGLKSLPPMNGSTPAKPDDSYAKHKAECEEYLKNKYGERKADYAILRIGAVFMLGKYGGNSMEDYKRFLFSVPADQRRHGVDVRDAGCAFAHAGTLSNEEWKKKGVTGKVLYVGGDATWRVTVYEMGNTVMEALGVGSLPREMHRIADVDTAYYAEDHMDTAESEAILNYQHHPLMTWYMDVRAGANPIIYFFTALVSPLIRYYIARKSPHIKYNLARQRDPEASMAMNELFPPGSRDGFKGVGVGWGTETEWLEGGSCVCVW